MVWVFNDTVADGYHLVDATFREHGELAGCDWTSSGSATFEPTPVCREELAQMRQFGIDPVSLTTDGRLVLFVRMQDVEATSEADTGP